MRGRTHCAGDGGRRPFSPGGRPMHSIIYMVGLIVIVLAVLSLAGLA
jgi:hypothetical protein